MIERQLQLMAAKPPADGGYRVTGVIVDELVNLPSCARCALLICDCRDAEWKGQADAN